MAKILIIDDDNALGSALQSLLSQEGFVVECALNGEDGLRLLSRHSYEVIILDWNLPEMSGEDVCRDYRNGGGQAPLLFLTGRHDISFLERGFDVGADDYITKPFESRELVARVKALLKRRSKPFQGELRVLDLLLKPEKNVIIKGDCELKLRHKEVALLEYLMRHPNQLFSAQQLLDAVWPADTQSGAHSVRTWIGLLRHKLATIGHEDLITTVAGAGYILELSEK